MSVGTPTAFLLWSILSCFFLLFLFFHLWSYDKFQCLRWNSGRQPGAFKRVMTYSYLATVPLLTFFNVTLTTIKYREGFIVTQVGKQHSQFTPRPFSLWQPSHKQWVLPLNVVFSTAWGLEIVTHLEELVFWLFLLHPGSGKRNWFRSWEYRTWCLGSVIAIIGLPLTALASRYNTDRCLAWIFFVGSMASTLTTICFLYVLARFPSFLREVKAGGAGPDVINRLSTFYMLNILRVMLRFLFTIPLLTLALDALFGNLRIILDQFWPDFLLMISGFGCVMSSAITLLIFFPRSTEEPPPPSPAKPEPHRSSSTASGKSCPESYQEYSKENASRPPSEVAFHTFRFPQTHPQEEVQISVRATSTEEGRCAYHRNARLHNHTKEDGSGLHIYVRRFTSPIDLPAEEESSSCASIP